MKEYKRAIIKLSGEALGDQVNHKIFDSIKLNAVIDQIEILVKQGKEIGLVCGAGNIFRGRIAEENGFSYEDGDYMGMVGTIINCKAISALLTKRNIKNIILSALNTEKVTLKYSKELANKYLSEGYVTLFAGGIGLPTYTTDTCSASRALDIDADLILAAKNGVDGVYDKDPNKYSDAKFLKTLSYTEVLERKLKVMDESAIKLLENSDIVLRVFSMDDYSNFEKIFNGDENIGTTIKKE